MKLPWAKTNAGGEIGLGTMAMSGTPQGPISEAAWLQHRVEGLEKRLAMLEEGLVTVGVIRTRLPGWDAGPALKSGGEAR